MAAAMVAVLSPAVSTCEPLPAAAVGAGVEPPIGISPPASSSSGLSIAKVPGNVFKNTSVFIKNNNASNSNNNNIITTTTTTRRLKPNSSSLLLSANNGIAASLLSRSATTNATSSESPAASPSSCINTTDTCEENVQQKGVKYSANIPHISQPSSWTASAPASPSSRHRGVVIDKSSSIIPTNSIDDNTDIADNVSLGPILTPKTLAITTNTTTTTNIADSFSTISTTKADNDTKVTISPTPSFAPTVTTTTTTSIITSGVASSNRYNKNNLCNTSSSSTITTTTSNSSSINLTSIGTTSTSIISTILKSNRINVTSSPTYPSLDSSSTTWITNDRITTTTTTTTTTNNNNIRLCTSASIATAMGPEEEREEKKGKGYPEVSDENNGTSVIIINTTTATTTTTTNSTVTTTSVAFANPKPNLPTTTSVKVLGNAGATNTNDTWKDITTTTSHNKINNNNETHRKEISFNNENNMKNNNKHKNNNVSERSNFDTYKHTSSRDDVSESNNNNNNNNNNNDRDNKNCSLDFSMACSERNYQADSDKRLLTINKSDNVSSNRSDICNEPTQNMREHDPHHINNNKNDDEDAESTAGDSDFDSPSRGTDYSPNCQAATTPSSININNSSRSSIASCSGSDSIVSSSITSTCATDSNNTNENKRSSSNKSFLVTNNISTASTTTACRQHIIVVPTLKSKEECNIPGTTQSNIYNTHANKNTNHDLGVVNFNSNGGSDVPGSKIRLAYKNGSKISARATDHSPDNELQCEEETDDRKPHQSHHILYRSRENDTTTLPEKYSTIPPSLALTPPPPPPPTTGRKNKRKLSEPKKRTDFSIKRFCLNNDGEGINDANYEESDITPTKKKVVHEISGRIDRDTSRFRLNADEAFYVQMDEVGHQSLLSQPSRPSLVQFGHPSARALLEAEDTYCQSLGRMSVTAAGQSLFESSLTAMGESCSASPTPLQLYQQRSRADIDDEDEDDDVDEDDDDDDDDDLDPDDIDDELTERTSPRSTLRPLRVPLSYHRRLSEGGVVNDVAINMRSSRTGVIRNREKSISRKPVSRAAITATGSEPTNPGKGFSVSAPIHNARTISAAAAAAVSSSSSVIPGSLSPLLSIPPPPHTLSPFTSHLNGFTHHHHLHNHQIHGVAEGVVGGFKSSGGVDLDTDGGGGGGLTSGKKTRKNYKNMTRERRIEANARERSRVHTISAAFENLRRAVPSYSCNQKLSKLAILRIACCYILALARLADMDYSEEQSAISFAECVDMCTKTIQTEGRARRRH